ncbi:stemmadenine O-acetyltransferase [Beta vulgaris subsp. vulgaris]|uniref:stemmadenine O-acetyltransferase n=1 Tax=Beta vulgaris subsp. vulgaris TaxID=3555 RepID=UPI0020375D69|nr:stemmadenine O-acetyltransferase [Beta vulgaris subsp. vulgaris]
MSLSKMNIKHITQDFIKPNNPTPNHLRLLRASLFDHVNTPVLMPLIFFYSRTYTTNIGTNQVLDRLKGSLPTTLSIFYPLAGRVHNAKQIDCNDEGVPYVQAVVDCPLMDIVYKAEMSQLDKLVPIYGKEGYTSLLLAIQVNVFACGALAIGVKMSHAISDAFSFFMFMKTWASIANGNHDTVRLNRPYFEISKLFPPPSPQIVNNVEEDSNQNPDLIQTRPVSKWFLFSETKLDAIRTKLFSYTNSNSLPSRPMVLSAFIWSRIKVACHNSVNIIPNEVYHAVNLRPRVNTPDENSYYFGNLVVNAIVNSSLVLNDDNNNSMNESRWLYNFLALTKESIEKIMSDGFIKEILEGKEDLRFMMEHFERESKGEIISLGLSNLRSLPVYEADFGWGKPIWVTSATLVFKDLIILIPAGPSSNDIVAYINLSSDDMAKLENDARFIELTSKATQVHSKI